MTHIADRKSRHLLRLARRRNPAARLVAIGCYAQRAPRELAQIEGVELVLGNDRKMNLLNLLGDTVTPPRTDGPAVSWQQSGRTRAFLKVQNGCQNFCAYCIVPLVRSREENVPLEKVTALVKGLVAQGYREVVLTGTEIGAYQGERGRPGRTYQAYPGGHAGAALEAFLPPAPPDIPIADRAVAGYPLVPAFPPVSTERQRCRACKG